MADQVGTNRFTVTRWEQGLAFPSPHFRQKLGTLFGCGLEELGLVKETHNLVFDEMKGSSRAEKSHSIASVGIPSPTIRGGMVGREALTVSLKERLCQQENPRVFALYGLPGVGKTSLITALTIDPMMQACFPGGVLWAGLGPNPSMPLILQEWGKLVGLTAEELATITDIDVLCHQLQRAINHQAMLILIDDAWNLEDALYCKVGGPQCAYIMTTRSLALATQFAPQATINVPELDEKAGMELLGRLAPQALATEAAAMQSLAHAVGGLPLALTLIGRYLRHHAVGGQPRRIHAAVQAMQQADLRLHVAEPLAPTERPRYLPVGTPLSLHTAIAMSDAMLDEPARQLMHAVAILPAKPERFDEATARAICGLASATFDQALDALIDACLVECVAPEQFTLHQVVADFGRTFPHQDVEQRLITYAVTMVETHQQDYAYLAMQFAILDTALTLAATQNPTQYIHGVIAIAPFLNSRSLFAEIYRHVSRSLDLTTENASRVMLLAHGASAKKNQGDYAQAWAWTEEGIALAHTLSEHQPLLLLLSVASELLIKQGQTRQAEALILEGLAIAHVAENHELLCRFLTRLAQVEERQNNLAQAEAHLLEALQVAEVLGAAGRVQASAILATLGVLRGKQGDFSGSAAFSRQGLILAQQLGYFERRCGLLINLSHAQRELGQLDEAAMLLQEAAAIARERGLRVRLCGILSNLSVLLAERGAFAAAQEHVQEGMAMAYALGSFERIAGVLSSCASVALLSGDMVMASAAIMEGLERARAAEDAYFVSTFSCQWGEVLLQENRVDEARAAFYEALTIAAAGQRHHLRAQALYGMARSAASQGNQADALRYGQESMQGYATIGHQKATEVQAWLTIVS